MPLRRRSRDTAPTATAAGVSAPAATTTPAAVGALGELRAGVDLGGTKILVVVVDGNNKILARSRAATPHEGGPQAVADQIADNIDDALGQAGADAKHLKGIGVGSPGSVDQAAGTVANASNLPDWIEPFPLGGVLSQRFGNLPVRLGNDVSVAVNAEYKLGAGRPYDSLLGVWWGTGVGGGLIIDRRQWDGRGYAGEFGHMVIELGGAKCGCGNRGCVEAYAGRRDMEAWVRKQRKKGKKTDLVKIMKHRERESFTSGIWAKGIRNDDKLAAKAVDRAIAAIAAGIGSTVNLLDVPAVVIGGGMGERFFSDRQAQFESETAKHLFRKEAPPALLATELGDDGGALGAALLALAGSN
ncbi:MAG: ROK family protein [Solirubrobacteraceae bacterium]|jgi:glucokinase|nr:ROK family protein [Solirubrobacteraceae bacterium]